MKTFTSGDRVVWVNGAKQCFAVQRGATATVTSKPYAWTTPGSRIPRLLHSSFRKHFAN